jgi:hypothetical protein
MISKSNVLLDTIDAALKKNNDDFYVCRPAVIASFNPSDQLAQVKVVIKGVLTLIENVPVQFPSCNTSGVYHAVNPDCAGVLFFIDHDIHDYLSTGGIETPPATTRTHHYNDCFFVPGIRPDTQPIDNFNNQGVTMFDGGSSVNLTDGTLTIDVDTVNAKKINCDDIEVDGKSLKNHTHGAGTLSTPDSPVTGSTGGNQ